MWFFDVGYRLITSVWIFTYYRLVQLDWIGAVSLLQYCGHVGGSISLGMGFRISNVQARPNVLLFLLSTDLDIKFSVTTPSRFLPVCHHASCHAKNELNLWNCKRTLVKCFLLQEFQWTVWWWHTSFIPGLEKQRSRQISLSSWPACSTELVSGQRSLLRETLSCKTKHKEKKVFVVMLLNTDTETMDLG